MQGIKARYEFRVWALTLASVHEKLGQLVQSKRTESQEKYLNSAATDKCNAKIRAGLMDVKVLASMNRGLEQWKPIVKAEFPLESSVIANQVFPALEVAAPNLSKPAYQLDEFLSDVVQPNPEIIIVDVRKTRYQFGLGLCAAEYAQVTINGVPRDTVAVESVDADAVLQLVARLGITDGNTSYVREIKRVLDLVPQQSGG
jgi:exopolyphosphatase/guanosine-5'-triphosphate,3'-diphosphate pyrophosphatase